MNAQLSECVVKYQLDLLRLAWLREGLKGHSLIQLVSIALVYLIGTLSLGLMRKIYIVLPCVLNRNTFTAPAA